MMLTSAPWVAGLRSLAHWPVRCNADSFEAVLLELERLAGLCGANVVVGITIEVEVHEERPDSWLALGTAAQTEPG